MPATDISLFVGRFSPFGAKNPTELSQAKLHVA